MKTRSIAAIALLGLAVACASQSSPKQAARPVATTRNPAGVDGASAYKPKFDPANFVETIDSPYHPLIPGTVRRYEGTTDGEKETNVITVTNEKRDIMGVKATVVRDAVYDTKGKLAEDTRDWFAQDKDGNVWYMGEDTKEFHGSKISTEGSWETGKKGGLPGTVMLARPHVGDKYQQEYGKGVAEDRSRVIALHETVTVPVGTFHDVIVIEESTPLEPNVRERKYYARGIGVVKEQLVSGGKELSQLVDVTPRRASAGS